MNHRKKMSEIQDSNMQTPLIPSPDEFNTPPVALSPPFPPCAAPSIAAGQGAVRHG